MAAPSSERLNGFGGGNRCPIPPVGVLGLDAVHGSLYEVHEFALGGPHLDFEELRLRQAFVQWGLQRAGGGSL